MTITFDTKSYAHEFAYRLWRVTGDRTKVLHTGYREWTVERFTGTCWVRA